MSNDALQQRLAVYAVTATAVLPHAGREEHHPARPSPHSCHAFAAHAGNDITVIALWLGHANVTTTQIYLQADMALKQQALDRTTPPATQPGRYKPPDQLLAFLEAL